MTRMRELGTGYRGRGVEDEGGGMWGSWEEWESEGGSVRSLLVFFFVFSKETMTKLCVGVFVLDILIYVFFIYLFILLWLNVPTIPCHFLKASHAWKLGLDCWLKEGDETKARRFVMGWWGGAELGRVRLFFSSPGPRMNSDTVDKRSGLRLDRTSLLLIQLPLLQLGWLVFTAGLTRAITD